MRYLTCIVLFLNINCYSQVFKFEHWDDKYNNENKEEVKKTETFINQNKIDFLKIYNSSVGVEKRFTDGLPYVFIKNGDTLTYLIPGGTIPTTREDYKIYHINDKKGYAYFIKEIRKDGRLDVISLYKYVFLIKERKLYFAFLTSKLSIEEEIKLYDKIIESTTEDEKNKIEEVINKNRYYKYELIFDFEKQKEPGDKIIPEEQRYSQLIKVSKTGNKVLYQFKTNITFFSDLNDREFIVDNDCNFYLIDGHEIKE